MISPVVAAALCMKPRSMLTINQASKVDVQKQGSHEFALMRSLAMRFRGILRSGESSSSTFGSTMPSAPGSLRWVRFARVLHRDIGAARNAVELPWSNGQAEGQMPDQPPEDDQTRDVWQSGRGAPQGAHATNH